jgi:DNA-binding transcriptional LysR family regulator
MKQRNVVVELRHIRIFLEMARTHSVSRTAEALEVTQPSVSIALARLRAFYSDPLFVRSGQKMLPTHRAQEMVEPLTAALTLFEQAKVESSAFDPATSTRRFSVAITEPGRVVFLPLLMQVLEELAPGVALDIVGIQPGTPDLLATGSIDMIFGYLKVRKAEPYRQELFKDRYVCLVRRDADLQTMTRKRYQSSKHIVIDSRTTSSFVLDATLLKNGIALHNCLSVPTYFGLAEVVQSTNLVATVPLRMALALESTHALKHLSLPVPSPDFPVSQYWHARAQHDEGHQWLRRTVSEFCATRLSKFDDLIK